MSFLFSFFLSIFFFFFYSSFTFFFLFYFSFNHLLLSLYLFSSFISYVFIYLFFSYLFYFFYFDILGYLFISLFTLPSQTSQVMPCWRLPTTLPHAMHRSDILNFHREYSKMYDAERISTNYIPSNRYLKRKKNGQKIINLKIPECH